MEKIKKDSVLNSLEPHWKPFNKHMLDKLYDYEGSLYIKTRFDSVYECTLQWKQGRGMNYFFGSEEGEDGHIVYPDDVVEYQKVEEVQEQKPEEE